MDYDCNLLPRLQIIAHHFIILIIVQTVKDARIFPDRGFQHRGSGRVLKVPGQTKQASCGRSMLPLECDSSSVRGLSIRSVRVQKRTRLKNRRPADAGLCFFNCYINKETDFGYRQIEQWTE